MSPRTPITLAAVAWIAVCLVGCSGEKGAKITGVVLDKGQPVQLKEKERLDLSLVASVKDKDSLKADPGADFKAEDGTFTFVGPGQGLVPPGDYKVAVVLRMRDGSDRFDGEFSPEKSPLTFTVAGEAKIEVVIDVDKKTITRKAP